METSSVEAFLRAIEVMRQSGVPVVVLGGGTNVIVSDEGFRGAVVRYTADRILAAGNRVVADAGAELQALVDFTIARGLKGLETLTRIPGSVGAAVYGNAGAYGHSISECILKVRFFDGRDIRVFDQEQCQFEYRGSIFKRHKGWTILSAELMLQPGDPDQLRRTAEEIARIRDAKFPPTMKCAGSIFKNLYLAQLPPEVAAQVPAEVVREGKVPAAWFLEQVGAKGMRQGDIHVAEYHANLVYNGGAGTARDLCALIAELKRRVRERFGIELEEEVQYVGFDSSGDARDDSRGGAGAARGAAQTGQPAGSASAKH
ncbi:MAG: UDP-N-acetylmuramate dehydrogenase [Bryobacteraceae bacterium]|nr:UDP-N-acetylmuramate dehydrogenase [Bryobacteraceae bacterium]